LDEDEIGKIDEDELIKNIAEGVFTLGFLLLVYYYLPDFVLQDVGISRQTFNWFFYIIFGLVFVIFAIFLLIHVIHSFSKL